MKCLVGIDDTDSSSGSCTTYLAYRITVDLKSVLEVAPYPRLVRLNPNVPFKTRGNAAVCLSVETARPDVAFARICAKVRELSDVVGGANSGVVFLEGGRPDDGFIDLYDAALSGLVNVGRAARLLEAAGARTMTLGNGMGLVGAASSLAFDERFDHTYELISYRRGESCGTPRDVDAASVVEMDRATFPHTFNNFDYQKRKVLLAPHGPDPVFIGVRGDSPSAVLDAFAMLRHGEELDGQMVYVSNQHTDAHLNRQLDWKVFSAGWTEGEVLRMEVGVGGHLYMTLRSGREDRVCAVYEPTGDLKRIARLLERGDTVRAYGGVRRATSLHPKVLNVERIDVLSLGQRSARRTLVPGSYVASPRANRHLTKPLARYGKETAGQPSEFAEGWLTAGQVRPTSALARSR